MNIRWKNRNAIEDALREDSGSTVVTPAEKSAPPNDTRCKLHVLTKALTAYRELLFGEELPAQEKPAEASPEKVNAFLAATAELRARVASEGNSVVKPIVVRPPPQGWAIWQWTALAASLCILATVTALVLMPAKQKPTPHISSGTEPVPVPPLTIPTPGEAPDVLLVDGLSAVDGPFVVMRGGAAEGQIDGSIIRQEAIEAANVARGTSGAPMTDADVVRLTSEWMPGKGLPPDIKGQVFKAGLALFILHRSGDPDRRLQLVLYDLKRDKDLSVTAVDLPDDVSLAKAQIRKAVTAILTRK